MIRELATLKRNG